MMQRIKEGYGIFQAQRLRFSDGGWSNALSHAKYMEFRRLKRLSRPHTLSVMFRDMQGDG
jgi:hypothetical protein